MLHPVPGSFYSLHSPATSIFYFTFTDIVTLFLDYKTDNVEKVAVSVETKKKTADRFGQSPPIAILKKMLKQLHNPGFTVILPVDIF